MIAISEGSVSQSQKSFVTNCKKYHLWKMNIKRDIHVKKIKVEK